MSCARSVDEIIDSETAWIEAECQRFLRDEWCHGPVTLATGQAARRRVIATARVMDDGDRRAYVSWFHPVDDLAPTG